MAAAVSICCSHGAEGTEANARTSLRGTRLPIAATNALVDCHAEAHTDSRVPKTLRWLGVPPDWRREVIWARVARAFLLQSWPSSESSCSAISALHNALSGLWMSV
jgi:hypothetical protein